MKFSNENIPNAFDCSGPVVNKAVWPLDTRPPDNQSQESDFYLKTKFNFYICGLSGGVAISFVCGGFFDQLNAESSFEIVKLREREKDKKLVTSRHRRRSTRFDSKAPRRPSCLLRAANSECMANSKLLDLGTSRKEFFFFFYDLMFLS